MSVETTDFSKISTVSDIILSHPTNDRFQENHRLHSRSKLERFQEERTSEEKGIDLLIESLKQIPSQLELVEDTAFQDQKDAGCQDCVCYELDKGALPTKYYDILENTPKIVISCASDAIFLSKFFTYIQAKGLFDLHEYLTLMFSDTDENFKELTFENIWYGVFENLKGNEFHQDKVVFL